MKSEFSLLNRVVRLEGILGDSIAQNPFVYSELTISDQESKI